MIWKAAIIGSRGGQIKRQAANIMTLAAKLRRIKSGRCVKLLVSPRFNIAAFWEMQLQALVSMNEKEFKNAVRRVRRVLRKRMK